jgi:hypothetical protein
VLAISWNRTAVELANAGRAAAAMAEQQPPDVARIFAALDAHRVDYVVVGGIADLADVAALTEPEHNGN